MSDYGTDMRRVVASPHSTPHVVIFNSDVSELLDEVEQVTNEALRAALRVELVNIHKEFGDHALIDMFWREIKSLDRKYLNQINLIHYEAIGFLTNYVTRFDNGLTFKQQHLSRDELKGKIRFESVIFDKLQTSDDPASFLLPTYVGLRNDIIEVCEMFDKDHWIYSETTTLPEFYDDSIKVEEVINFKAPFNYLSDEIPGGVPVVLCEHIVMDGPLGKQDNYDTAYFNGRYIFVPNACISGTVIGQCSFFAELWGMREDILATEEQRFYQEVERHREAGREQLFNMMLMERLWLVDRQAFAGCDFTVSIRQDGTLLVRPV